MTVSEIRELILEKVIPESLMPQNIAVCLMDENAAPPELDAFTFLNRLRSLGIGSADFLYLLKGCGAPEEAVAKIEQHPDMNLQSLIVTLDGSGLTAKDYTRMLYTARQLWEHTITMRLEKADIEAAEKANSPKVPETPKPQSEPAQPDFSATAELINPASITVAAVPDEPSEPGKPGETQPEAAQSETESKPVKTARQKKRRKNYDDEPEEVPAEPPVMTARQKKRTIDDLAEELGIAAEIEDEPEEKYTARQRRKKKSEETAEEEPQQSEEIVEDSPKARRNAIIAAAAGAAVLFALDPVMDILGFANSEISGSQLHFAADSTEIFSEIYTAYSSGSLGGSDIQPIPQNEQVFGELLINSGVELGVFSDDTAIWTADPDVIRLYNPGEASGTAEILPPEGAEFVRVFQTESGITAVYSSGSECGLMGVDGSGAAWNSSQSGALTDIFCDGDVIRLGSVYTPAFTRSFTIEDELEYLPWTASGGSRTAFAPAEVAVSGGADGCSYAVWCEYGAENGALNRKLSALGDPLFSGAEKFTAAMRNMLISLDNEKLHSQPLSGITACAYGDGLTADVERSGDSVTVYIRGNDLQPLSAFTTGSDVDALRISGGVLYACSGGKTVMAADISEPSSPAPLDLTAAFGRVSGDYALCGAAGQNGITLTLYKLDNGSAVQSDSFAKQLTAAELETFSFRGVNSFVINGAECSGAAYRYFDGVSMVDEFAELGRSRSLHTLYDDREGFTAALSGDRLALISGDEILQ